MENGTILILDLNFRDKIQGKSAWDVLIVRTKTGGKKSRDILRDAEFFGKKKTLEFFPGEGAPGFYGIKATVFLGILLKPSRSAPGLSQIVIHGIVPGSEMWDHFQPGSVSHSHPIIPGKPGSHLLSKKSCGKCGKFKKIPIFFPLTKENFGLEFLSSFPTWRIPWLFLPAEIPGSCSSHFIPKRNFYKDFFF